MVPPSPQPQNTQKQPFQRQTVEQSNQPSEIVGNEVKSDLHLGVNPQRAAQQPQSTHEQSPHPDVQHRQETVPQEQITQQEQASQPEALPKKSRHTAVIVIAVLIFIILAGIAIYAGLIRQPVT